MYNITIETIITILFIYKLLHLVPNKYNILTNFFHINFSEYFHNIKTYFLFDYCYDYLLEDGLINEKQDNQSKAFKGDICKNIDKFENKYLNKFKSFSNEFYFNQIELEAEQKECEKISYDMRQKIQNSIYNIKSKLKKINDIENNGGITINSPYTKNINNFGIEQLLLYFDLKDTDEEYREDGNNLEELYNKIITEKTFLIVELKKMEETTISNDEVKEIARKAIIDEKLDKFINNYIIENTPMGNVYMRYNHNKHSFEYFSNNSIPYKYLETLGRKYVITYWCKPIFVDMEEELKISEIKYDENSKNNNNKKQVDIKINNKNVLAKMKSYNKDTKNQTLIHPTKNRTNGNVLLPQIKSNLQNVNKIPEKQLLKDKSNRYTWEGRLSDFCPLKKIDKKVVNKSLNLTYNDFKRMQK